MRMPVQVMFHNMDGSSSLEQDIHERAAWLQTFYTGLQSCRVLVAIPHRHRERGRLVHVRIELAVPGPDVVVSHDRNQESDGAHKDAFVAVHDAFDIARRRLEDFARRQRGDVKSRSAPA